jgi:hypothetical protein
MTKKELLDLYSEYLISAFGQTTGTGLAAMMDGAVSHDQIQRFLAGEAYTSVDLWHIVKPHVRALQSEDGVLIVDDSIAEKPYSDENDLICWHDDYAKDRPVKGINFVNVLYYTNGLSLPVGFALVAKTEYYLDKKDGRQKRRSPISKNQSYQRLVQQAKRNRIPFKDVLNDTWYASAENMKFVKRTLHKEFVMPIKTNRKVALSKADQQHGRFVPVETVALQDRAAVQVWLEDVDFPLLLVKQVFVNEDAELWLMWQRGLATR